MLAYRNEFKFLCSRGELEIVRARLSGLMRCDAHQIGESYRVRSLYFDDHDDSAFFENAAGADDRRKFRLRVYDQPCQRIQLETKYKLRGKTRKEACPVSETLCRTLMTGSAPPWDPAFPPPLALLYAEMRLHRMEPKIIVEYERTAFVYPVGNVRVTFDRNIAWSDRTGDFLNGQVALCPTLPTGMHVLEVKYDELLPDFLLTQLGTGELSWTSFSKYYLSRLAQRGEELC